MSTLVTIRGNVRRNLGDTSADTSKRMYTDLELNQAIGDAYSYYTRIMITKGEGYFETTTNLGFTAGVETISLAALNPPFLSVSAIERRIANGTIPLMRSERRFRANYNIGVGVGDSYQPNWKIRGQNLVLEPQPNSTEAGTATTGLKFDYNYIPTFPTSASADNFSFDANFPTIFESMVELNATISALESKDAIGGVSDITTFRQSLQEQENIFLESLENSEAPELVVYSGLNYDSPFNY